MYLVKIAFLLLCNQIVAQDFIETIDGQKIDVVEGSIKVEPGNNRLTYKLPNSPKRKKIKFKALSAAAYNDYNLNTFVVDGKRKAFFILADSNGKRLGALPSQRSVSKGGFEVPYMRYELAVIDSNGKVSEYQVFTDVNNTTNIELRKQAAEMIRRNFDDCPNLLMRLKTFENSESKIQNSAVAELLDKPYQISCN